MSGAFFASKIIFLMVGYGVLYVRLGINTGVEIKLKEREAKFMKQRKKIAILLVVTLVLQMMPLPVGSLARVLGVFSVSQAATDSGTQGDISWSVNGTVLTLAGTGSSTMPNYYEKYWPDGKGSGWWASSAPWGKYSNEITSVTVSGVTSIGNYAFCNLKKLTGISGSDSVSRFGSYAFSGCSALSTISLKSNAAMGSYVFEGTALTQVIWPSGSDTISEGAFQNCAKITTIEIPAQVRTIGKSAFSWCSGATSITGLDNATSIGTGVFSSCNQLTDIVWSKNVLKISDSAFANCTGLTSITIPDYVTEIGSYAFTSCTGVAGTLTIPNNVTKIGNSAFNNCASTTAGITEVIVGTGVTSIGDSAFYNCHKLASLEWKTTTLNRIGAGAFSQTAFTKFIVPQSVSEIGTNPFVGGSLKEIEVEQGNTKYAVENKMLVTKDAPKKMVISYPCHAGSDAVVPDTVKVIGGSAFNSAKVLTVDLPEGIESMGTYAFASSALTTVKLPKSLQSVSQYAFYYTERLQSVEFQQGLEKIEGCAFYKASALKKVSFPGSLLTIESSAFQEASSLTSVDGTGGRLKTIGNSVFQSCGKLSDVRFGGDLETLGNDAFKYCENISEITLPDKLRIIGTGVFTECRKLTRIVFPNSIERVGASALSGCIALKSVDFGSIVQEITGDVFKGCRNLAKVTMSNNNPNMVADENVLYNKDKTKIIYYAAGMPDDKFSVPKGVETVGSMAFTDCEHLEELRFPETVKALRGSAVYDNRSINKIFFYGDAPTAVLSSNSTTKWENGKQITTTSCKNGSIIGNQVGSGSNNDGLIIFVKKTSTGWDTVAGWKEDKDRKDKDTEISKYVWSEQYLLDQDRWDPEKTDESTGKFPGTNLSWIYRDDIGELKFIGEGEIPDYNDENKNLFTWVDENADEWLGSIGEPKDYMPDVKLVETGGATRIGNNTFKGAGQLYRVLTESCLAEIGESAFADCPKLAVVDVSNVQKIEKEAFKNDSAIKDDMDARGVKEIGEGAFSGCTGMTEILLGEGLKSLGKEAFDSCSALETMMIPESTETLGEGCFTGCSTLRTVNIPAAVQNIEAACFKDCSGLQKVYFYGDCPVNREADAFDGAHADLVLYCRAANTTWNGVSDWNGIPVVHLDKFYTEREDHYSFANTGSSFGYSPVYYIPLQRFVTATQSIVRGSFYHAWNSLWGGSCFGMASSSTEFYQGNEFNVKDYTATADKLYDVSAPRDDRADLTKLIEIYQVSQFESTISSEIAKNNGARDNKAYRKLIKQVEEFERSGGLFTDETADPLVMCLYATYVGHAVVPVAVNMDAEGNYILDVYDSNYPDSFQKLKIRKDFKGIEYKGYQAASFVKYSTIRDALQNADFTGLHVERQEKESDTVAIAINRKDVSLTNSGDRDYKEIEGAYEQRPMSEGREDEFGGIRSFILPQGEYIVEEQEGTARNAGEELQYYVATEDLFSEIKTSDEDAELKVRSIKGTGYDVVTLSSEQEDTKTDLTVMDVSGIEKEISVTGKSIEVEVNDDSQMELTVSEGAAVTVDGEPLVLSDGNKATVSFYAEADDNPIAADDFFCELYLDEDNKLSGTAQTYMTWKKELSGNVDIITKLSDEDGNQIAKYTETKKVGLGLQAINTKLERVTTELGKLSGKFNVICEMTLADSNGNRVTLDPVVVSLKAAGEEPAPEQPTEKPTPTPTPTAKPSQNNPSGGAPIVITASPAPTMAATATPTPVPSETLKPTAKPDSVATPEPVVTPDPVETPEPEDPSGTVPKSSVPKKGQIKAVGAVKYVVTKSSKKNGTVAVYGAKKKNAAKIVLPKKVKINGYTFKVTEIRKNAFSNMKKLSEVKLGANIKKIGNNAFKNCKKLQFVIIPKKVTTIGKGSFAGCTKLIRMLVKSNKIKSVGEGAFKGVTSNMIVKTSKQKWRQYSKMFTGKGKMSRSALFIIDPVKLKFGNKTY